MIDDPTAIYEFAIMHSSGEGGSIARTFEDARDNPKIPKLVLMAAVLAGWMACARYLNEREHLLTETSTDTI